jgi:hypothetical protein
MKDGREEMTACQEKREAYPEIMEPTSLDVESKVEHEEVLKEGATVKSLGALRKQHGSQKLAAGCHWNSKEQSWGNCGSWKKFATARKGMTCCGGMARCKVHVVRKSQTRNKAGRGTSRGWMFRRRHHPKQEHKNGIRNNRNTKMG